MVMPFFRKSESGLDHIAQQTLSMLSDARHSFDLASMAVLSGADPKAIGADIRETDHRINETEQRLRSELVVHVSVRGGEDIGVVMGYTLLIKKSNGSVTRRRTSWISQTKACRSWAPTTSTSSSSTVRRSHGCTWKPPTLLTSHDEAAAREFLGRALALKAECETKVRDD